MLDLSRSWREFSVEFTATGFAGTVQDGRLRFWFAGEAQAGDADRERDERRHEHGQQRGGDEVEPAEAGHGRVDGVEAGRVGADGEKARMAELEQAGHAADHVQRQGQDGQDANLAQDRLQFRPAHRLSVTTPAQEINHGLYG